MLHSDCLAKKTLLALSISLVSFTGYADQNSSGRIMTLEEVIVTAQKREESLQDTPISIVTFGVEALEQMGVTEAGQVGVYTPNVQISKPPGSPDNYGYSIRGMSSTDPSLLTEPTVGLYADGVYIARISGAAFDLVDLERIEVLRGPQGALYGRNAIGGAINLISQKPSDEFGLMTKLAIGNRNYQRIQATVNSGKMGDFTGKLSYANWSKDGWLDNLRGNNKLGETKESESYRLALRWTPTESLTLDYVYDKSDKLSNGSLPQLVHVRPFQAGLGGAIYAQAAEFASEDRLDALPMAFSQEPDTWSNIDGHALTAQWEAQGITFKSITAYREWDSGTNGNEYGSFPSDGLTVLDGTGGVVPSGEQVPLFLATRVSSQRQFTQEFQAIGSAFDDKLQYTAGLYYFEEQAKEDNPQTFILPATIAYGALPQATQSFLCRDPSFADPTACLGKDTVLSTPIFVYGSDNKSYAVFGQFSYALNDQWEATLGLRYTHDDKSAFLSNSNIIRNEGLDIVNAEDTWSNFNPSLTVSYQINDQLSSYATVATGFRSGGNNARASTAHAFSTPFDEENVISYELGMKSDWLDQRLRINAAVFHYVYEDKQVAQFEAGSAGASSIIANAGEQEATGLEIELTAIPIEGLVVTAAYGYIDIDINEFETKPSDPVTGLPTGGSENVDVSGFAQAGHSPKNTGSLQIQYEFEPFDFGQLTLHADATYTDERVFHPLNNLFDSAKAQTLVNARMTLSDLAVPAGNLRISAWGKNLENKEYREWGIDFAALGFAVDSYQELRSYGIDIVYEY